MKKKIITISAAAAVFGGIFAFAFNALAFVGPTQNPPGGNGAFASDSSNNLAIGTSTTASTTKFLVIGASNDASTYAIAIKSSNATPLLLVRDDGAVSIATTTVTAGSTVIGNNLVVGGTVTASGLGGSTISAGNVSAGQFGSNTGGGNFSFPAAVNVSGTLSAASGTFTGPVSINTSTQRGVFTVATGSYGMFEATNGNFEIYNNQSSPLAPVAALDIEGVNSNGITDLLALHNNSGGTGNGAGIVFSAVGGGWATEAEIHQVRTSLVGSYDADLVFQTDRNNVLTEDARFTSNGSLDVNTTSTSLGVGINDNGSEIVTGKLYDGSGNAYATSSSVTFNIYNATTTVPYSLSKIYTANAKTVVSVSCSEYASATTTVQLFYTTSTANTTGPVVLSSIACGHAGASTASFTNATIPAGGYLFSSVTATAGTPTWTTVNVAAASQ
ncbi:MAG TPA: hypothetical protein VMA75_01155 [Candidatus Paceibacterota bacterium]|nr:hypothetical protein [Candidatus Paceibacterota bacterium]